jgi:hypothetical protein
MFGGLGFLVDGHLAAGASSQGGMKGREMVGWLHLLPEAVESDDRRGVGRPRVAFARSLPPK